MNIAIIGYGAMGQAIEKIAIARNHVITAIIDPSSPSATHKELTSDALINADITIDFSTTDSVIKHIDICKEASVNLILGTTGWYDKLDSIRQKIKDSNIGFLWSSNFSIGVNIYYKLIEDAAELINRFDEYDIWGHEIHHKNKADSPSGTAKILEQILLNKVDRKTEIVEDKLDRKIEPNEIHFSSTRGGEVNFKHEIGFDSAADTIIISHSARNRDGYALGAVKAAEWLNGKIGYYEMSDFLNI